MYIDVYVSQGKCTAGQLKNMHCAHTHYEIAFKDLAFLPFRHAQHHSQTDQ